MLHNLVGQQLKGYEVQALVGTGGFGAVYRAHQPLINRQVALKVIWSELANQTEFIRRFEAEAQLIARLEHPQIVPLYDYWRDPDGAYLVMRWIRWGSLRVLLDQRGAIPGEQVVALFAQIAGGLTFAHRAGVIHRDIKPENILLDDDQNAYLTDFGISQFVDAVSDDDEDMTTMGSLAYASPEHLAHKPTLPASDQYSLGIVLYEMLTGKHPFPGLDEMSATGLLRYRSQEPVPLLARHHPQIHPAVDAIIQRMTALDPPQRYPDLITPVREFEALYQARKVKTGTLVLATEVLPNPYKGLQAFQEADANNFFGREHLVEHLLRRMQETSLYSRFLAIVGPSGSGKSSVARAGISTAVRQGGYFLAEMVPGPTPFEELATALISVASEAPADLTKRLRADAALNQVVCEILPQGELVLIIDQFEEVFTLVADPAETNALLDALYMALTAPDSRLRIVITLRADFYAYPLMHPLFSQLIRQRTEVVIPLTTEELERAIVAPAARTGVTMEPALVAAIIAEMKEQPGALPLLQYALKELFDHREGREIRLSAYQALGGALGTLAKRAEALFEGLSPLAQRAARQLFMRLVTLGEGTEDTRRRVPMLEIMTIESDFQLMQQVVDVFGTARLLIFDHDPITHQPTVEVAHEALLREWARLRQWLDTSREDLRLQRSLATQAAEWQAAKREKSFLLTGARLDQFERWSGEVDIGLTQQEVEYLASSLMEQKTRQHQEEARKAREEGLEIRARNRLRIIAVVMTAAFILSSGLALLAYQQQEVAREERDNAAAAQSIAQTQAAVAEANAQELRSLVLVDMAQAAILAGNKDTGLALGLLANQITYPPVAARTFLYQMSYVTAPRLILQGHQSSILAVALSPDGRFALTGGREAQAFLWDAASGEQLYSLDGHSDNVTAVAFSPDSQLALTGSQDGTIILWNTATGAIERTLTGHSSWVRAAIFSADGQAILSGGRDNRLILWDTATGAMIRQFEGHTGVIRAVAFLPDQAQIVSGSEDGTILVWNIADGNIVQSYQGESDVLSLAVNPDGSSIAAGFRDKSVILWEIASGEVRLRYGSSTTAHTAPVRSVIFKGDRLITAGEDNMILVWNAASGELLDRYLWHREPVTSLAVRDQVLLSGSEDGTALLWALEGAPHLNTLYGHHNDVIALALSADGTRLLSGGNDQRMILWDTASGKPLNEMMVDTGSVINSVTLSPDGNVAVAASNNELIVWNIATGETRSLGNYTHLINSVAFQPDGRHVLAGSSDYTVRLWDIETGEAVFTQREHDDLVLGIALSPDGTRALSGSRDDSVILWDVEHGTMLDVLNGHTKNVFAVAFSPDGQTALSAGEDTHLILWNLQTGEMIRQMEGHNALVWSVAFAPDGLTALSSAADNTLILWNVATGEMIQRFTTRSVVRDIDFSPAGNWVVLAESADTISQLRVQSLAQLLHWLPENRVLHEFSCDERLIYALEPC